MDQNHPMNRYGKHGLLKFVDGTYSWAVRSAMMLGYARHGYAPHVELKVHLDKFGTDYALVGSLARRDASSSEPHFYVSVHERRFDGIPSGADGYIAVHHMWFTVA
ncbi:MAG: hypothetical protein Q8P18_21355 [Pseudomonadota bacterium]|nr:hypothetical protein [Pseudomonadota bacterium]